MLFHSPRTSHWCSILFIDNSSCEGPCNLQRYNTALHPQHFSASFTAKCILLLASFGYYWQLEGTKPPCVGDLINFWFKPRWERHSQKHKCKINRDGKLLTILSAAVKFYRCIDDTFPPEHWKVLHTKKWSRGGRASFLVRLHFVSNLLATLRLFIQEKLPH